jgi:alkylhydroperoxidase domain protein/CMD domain protein
MSDVLNQLAGVVAGSPAGALRARRPEATSHAQGSYEALFQPADPGGVGAVERFAIALRVAVHHEEPRLIDHYRGQLLAAADGSEALVAAVESGDVEPGSRVAAQLAHADLLATHPVDAQPSHLKALRDAGLSVRDVVTTSQLIAFVSFQARVLAGLLLLQGVAPSRETPAGEPRIHTAAARGRFTQDQLQWTPWLEPLGEDELRPEHEAALPGPRAKSPYFRLLAHDPAILIERTATDDGIFRSPDGLPRAERELAAAATSRVNGCVYCASVHARLASQFSKRFDDVQRLLDEGVEARQDPRWRALIDFAAALGQTPSRADLEDLAALREQGLSDLEILDAAQASGFFAWANRLMLTLGEPSL